MSEWISMKERLPDYEKVRIRLSDGSEVNCVAETDGDFYWAGCGFTVFIPEHYVTHWIGIENELD